MKRFRDKLGRSHDLYRCTLNGEPKTLVMWVTYFNQQKAAISHTDPAILDGDITQEDFNLILSNVDPDVWLLNNVDVPELKKWSDVRDCLDRRCIAKGATITAAELARVLSDATTSKDVMIENNAWGDGSDDCITHVCVDSEADGTVTGITLFACEEWRYDDPKESDGFYNVYLEPDSTSSHKRYQICYDCLNGSDFAKIVQSVPGETPVYVSEYDGSRKFRIVSVLGSNVYFMQTENTGAKQANE